MTSPDENGPRTFAIPDLATLRSQCMNCQISVQCPTAGYVVSVAARLSGGYMGMDWTGGRWNVHRNRILMAAKVVEKPFVELCTSRGKIRPLCQRIVRLCRLMLELY